MLTRLDEFFFVLFFSFYVQVSPFSILRKYNDLQSSRVYLTIRQNPAKHAFATSATSDTEVCWIVRVPRRRPLFTAPPLWYHHAVKPPSNNAFLRDWANKAIPLNCKHFFFQKR